jgi:hypothetical protein
MDKDINEGLCWEYCFADNGGPADTANELRKWIEETNRFIDIKDFHEVCENCVYCQWGR